MTPAYSLAQCIQRLPAHARNRYEDLKASVADATALVNTLQERFVATQEEYSHLQHRYTRAVKTGSDEAAQLQADLAAIVAKAERLERERSRRNSVAANSGQVVSRLQSFIEAWWLSGSSNITEPPRIEVTPQLHEGESVTDAVTRLRTEINKVRGELAYVKAAPLPADEVMLQVMDKVDAKAEQGRPYLQVNGTKVQLDWPDEMEFTLPGQSPSAPAGGASNLLCWAFRDLIAKRLIAGITDLKGCIPSAERPGRLQALEERLFTLEVEEEHWVSEAIASGLEVHRRSDASPWAVLGYGLRLEAPPAIAEAAE